MAFLPGITLLFLFLFLHSRHIYILIPWFPLLLLLFVLRTVLSAVGFYTFTVLLILLHFSLEHRGFWTSVLAFSDSVLSSTSPAVCSENRLRCPLNNTFFSS